MAAVLLLAACGSTPSVTPPQEVRIEPRLSPHGIAWSESGTGQPLVLLNGTGSPMAEWDPAFLAALGTHRRVIVFDYPGLGESTTPVRRTFAAMASATTQLMTDLGVERADVLGWSMGGFVTQQILRREPARVNRAVLVGTNPGGDRATLGPRWVQRADSDPEADIETYLRTNYPHTRCAQRRGRAFIGRLDDAVAAGRYPEPTVPSATYESMVAAEDPWLASNHNAAQLRSVQVPVLVLVGLRDVITPPENSRALVGLLPKSQLLEVPAAGHSVLFQAPQEAAAAITAFLDGEGTSVQWPCA